MKVIPYTMFNSCIAMQNIIIYGTGIIEIYNNMNNINWNLHLLLLNKFQKNGRGLQHAVGQCHR